MDIRSIGQFVKTIKPVHLISGARVMGHIIQLKKNQWKPLADLKKTQLIKLKKIVHHAYKTVPYYRNLFDSVRFNPNDLRSLNDLKKIPITTKQAIRDHFEEMVSISSNKETNKTYYTSGSTGMPLNIIRDPKTRDYLMALKAYAFYECGVRPTDRFMTLAQSEETVFPNQRSFSATSDPIDMVKHLKTVKPDIMYGYSSVLAQIASEDVSGMRPRMIFSQGLKLTPHCRDLLKYKFGVEVFDTYGSVEFSRLAFECKSHSGFHMITDCAVMEFLVDGRFARSGEPGEVVVTGFHNFAMPLIRYKIDDVAVPTDEVCPCGRTWPLIKTIEGRSLDFFTMPSGKKIFPGFLYYAMHTATKEDVQCISQFQIVQRKFDEIVVNVVKGKTFRPDILALIKGLIEEEFFHIGEKISVDVRTVENISRGKTGKSRIMISEVNQSTLAEHL